jgi:hypothetical protein
VKRGVVLSLVSRAKLTCQDWKDFNKESNNIRCDLILNEYLQEFVDSKIKPGRGKYNKYILAQSLSHVRGSSGELGTSLMLGPLSKLNTHFLGH